MRRDIQAFAATDGVIYAECGGLMYLCSALRTLDGIFHSMRDVLPGETRMCERLQALGYVEVQLVSDSILGHAGSCFRGHQFKYSNIDIQEQVVTKAFKVQRPRDGKSLLEGYQVNNVLGSYVRAHWASNPNLPLTLVAACSTSVRQDCHGSQAVRRGAQ